MEFGESRIAAQIAATPVTQALKAAVPQETPRPLVVERVTLLRTELETMHQNSDANRISLLLLRLAEAQQAIEFGTIWLTIFGSQLEALAGIKAIGEPIDLTPYFEVHHQRYGLFSSTRDSPAPPLSVNSLAILAP